MSHRKFGYNCVKIHKICIFVCKFERAIKYVRSCGSVDIKIKILKDLKFNLLHVVVYKLFYNKILFLDLFCLAKIVYSFFIKNNILVLEHSAYYEIKNMLIRRDHSFYFWVSFVSIFVSLNSSLIWDLETFGIFHYHS